MRTELRDLELEIQQLELEIAELKLLLIKKEIQQHELKKEQQHKTSLATDRRQQPIFKGSVVRVLTPSTKAEFVGIKKAVVVGKLNKYRGRILIARIGREDIVTTREPYNVLVLK